MKYTNAYTFGTTKNYLIELYSSGQQSSYFFLFNKRITLEKSMNNCFVSFSYKDYLRNLNA